MKKHYYIVLDVETANSTEDALVYDLGYAVTDRNGHIYECGSFINRDIFIRRKELMQTAYYAEKVPKYWEQIKRGEHKIADLYEIRQAILAVFDRYPITAVFAYNASFDYRALNTTQRYLTKSKYRYFLPYGTQVWDIWNFACNTICLQKGYRKFCLENGFVSASGNIQTSAEVVYAYITKNKGFTEEHTGLADVFIETAILAKCYATHKKCHRKINRACWRVPQVKKPKGKRGE